MRRTIASVLLGISKICAGAALLVDYKMVQEQSAKTLETMFRAGGNDVTVTPKEDTYVGQYL